MKNFDTIWAWLCDSTPTEGHWRTKDLPKLLAGDLLVSEATAKVYLFRAIRQALEGVTSLKRVSAGVYGWKTAEELEVELK